MELPGRHVRVRIMAESIVCDVCGRLVSGANEKAHLQPPGMAVGCNNNSPNNQDR